MKNFEKGTERLKKIFQRLSSYIGFGVLILLALSLLSSISRVKDVDLKISKEKEKVDKLKKEKEELQKNLEVAQSEGYIEKQLRDKLGMAKDGEIVVILPDAEIVKRFAPKIDEEEEVLPDPNWKKWMRIFGLVD